MADDRVEEQVKNAQMKNAHTALYEEETTSSSRVQPKSDLPNEERSGEC